MNDSEVSKCIHQNGYSGTVVVEFSDGKVLDGIIFKFDTPTFTDMNDSSPLFESGFYFLKTDDIIQYQKISGVGIGYIKNEYAKRIMKKVLPEQIMKIMSRDEYHQKKYK